MPPSAEEWAAANQTGQSPSVAIFKLATEDEVDRVPITNWVNFTVFVGDNVVIAPEVWTQHDRWKAGHWTGYLCRKDNWPGDLLIGSGPSCRPGAAGTRVRRRDPWVV